MNDEICVTGQIESREGVKNVEDIAAVEGVDALFIGPSDLSAAYGVLGQTTHPDVVAAIERIVAAGKARGKPIGILAPVETDARRYLEMGMTYVAVGRDTGTFKTATKALADRYKTEKPRVSSDGIGLFH